MENRVFDHQLTYNSFLTAFQMNRIFHEVLQYYLQDLQERSRLPQINYGFLVFPP